MIELRWVIRHDNPLSLDFIRRVLQYRWKTIRFNEMKPIANHLEYGEWSDWIDVPEVDESSKVGDYSQVIDSING